VDGPGGIADAKHLAFQQWEWRWQRVGWVLLAGVVVAGLAGLLGDGPLSSTSSSSTDGAVQASFDRFLHRSDPAVIGLRISEPKGELIDMHVNSEFLHRVRILRLTPEPVSEIADPTGITFQFAAPPRASAVEIAVHLEPEKWGTLQGDFSLSEGSQVNVAQFVYP
jgi:hypothetical protein